MSGLSSLEIDKKPFKGKGAEDWLAQLHREYDKIVYDMEELSRHSKNVAGSTWYVYMHHRRSTGQRFLMWRSFGVKHIHLTWDSMQPLLGRMTQSQKKWYGELNEKVRLLNAKEVATRKAVRLAQGLVESPEGGAKTRRGN